MPAAATDGPLGHGTLNLDWNRVRRWKDHVARGDQRLQFGQGSFEDNLDRLGVLV